MQSAFGVDHGDISKIAMPAPVKRGASTVSRAYGNKAASNKAARKARQALNTNSAQRATASAPGSNPTGPQRAAGALHRIGSADISLKGVGNAAGAGTKKVGDLATRFPGTTGALLTGGSGAAAYTALSRKEPKRRG